MPKFDVEKEVIAFTRDWVSNMETPGSPTSAALRDLVRRAIEATEEEIVKFLCQFCNEDAHLERDENGWWFHPWVFKGKILHSTCSSGAIHERRRRREQG